MKTSSSTSAVALIKQDHRAVEKLYREYKTKEGDEAERNRLAEEICKSLEMHAKMEEKHFYPALRKKTSAKGDLKVTEAYAEHLGMKALVKTVKSLPEGRIRGATMKTLMDVVKHHMKEEESEMLPEAERLLGNELESLGKKMAALSPSEKQRMKEMRVAM
jgi:hemerythrin superfamily protein